MNNFLIIDRKGKIHDVEKFIKSGNCSKIFKLFLDKEMKAPISSLNKKKPNYLKIARKLGFDWEKDGESGHLNYDYKADLVMRLIKEYSRELVQKIGIPVYEVRGSNMFDKNYPVVQSYANLYGERLYNFKAGKKEIVMNYDASYPQFNLAAKHSIKEKHLPFSHFSISDCYRFEQSGELMMFYRNRRFFMPDLHPYFKNIDQAFQYYNLIEEQIVSAAREVNRNYHVIAEVGSKKDWEENKEKIRYIAIQGKRDVLIKIHSDNKPRYWIINVDYKIMDQLDQSREIGCIQIDVGNAKRLGIEYLSKEGKKKNPVIIHSAVPGGIERFLYMLLDDFGNFPIWLHPIQLRMIPVSKKYVKDCSKVLHPLKGRIRFDIDDKDEVVSKKIKKAHEELIPNVVVFGEEERRKNGNYLKFQKIVDDIIKQGKNKPFIEKSWPILLSNRL